MNAKTRMFRAVLMGAALLAGAPALHAAPGGAHPAAHDAARGPLTIADEGSFFVGGHEAHSDTLSTLPQIAPVGTVTLGQMYVQYQIPVHPAPVPVVFIHGCCLTGASWETTPDGRMGWSQYFVRKGYATYVIDQVARGRSAANTNAITAVKLGKAAPDSLPVGFNAGHEGAWTLFRFGPRYPESYPDSQFPLATLPQFWKQMVPDWGYSMGMPNPTVPALSALAIRLRRAVLVSHSQSGIYPFQTLTDNPAGIAGVVAIEPAACPAANGDVRPYAPVPILLLWGDHVAESPIWAPRLEGCRAFASAVNLAGGHATVLLTTDLGMFGNTHMLMQDRNNLAIADAVIAWIRRAVR